MRPINHFRSASNCKHKGVEIYDAMKGAHYIHTVLLFTLYNSVSGFQMKVSKWSSSTARLASTSEPTDSPLLLLSLADKWAKPGTSKSESPLTVALLVLASQSPRRREILDMMMLKDKYAIQPSPIDEAIVQAELIQQGLTSTVYTQKLAEAKALAVAELCQKDSPSSSDDARPIYFLGSDTIVELDGGILEKPNDPEEAVQMLSMLSGRQHHVHTGVALYKYQPGGGITLESSFTETATVTFATLNEETIRSYVATGEPLDKAGAYGIQGIGGQLVSNISGDFFTVMGLPMHKTSQLLAQVVAKS